MTGVEAFNGSTYYHDNLYAYATTELGLPSLGASDAHVLEKIGIYVTTFYDSIRDDKDLVEAIKSKNFHPVMRKDGEFKNFDYCYEEILSKEKELAGTKRE